MKTLFLLLYISFAMVLSAQQVNEKYYLDIRDNLQYEYNGQKASFTENIFGDWVYSDSRSNKCTYTKDYLDKALMARTAKFRTELFRELIAYFKNSNHFTEKYSMSISGALQYESSDRYKASFSIDIFKNQVFKDSNGNELKISKYFIPFLRPLLPAQQPQRPGVTPPRTVPATDAEWFKLLIGENVRRTNVKEEFYVAEYNGPITYKNSEQGSAKLQVDVFSVFTYTDSKGNKVAISKDLMPRDRNGTISIPMYFLEMINKHLMGNTDNKNTSNKNPRRKRMQ